jgi:hypothetical protein
MSAAPLGVKKGSDPFFTPKSIDRPWRDRPADNSTGQMPVPAVSSTIHTIRCVGHGFIPTILGITLLLANCGCQSTLGSSQLGSPASSMGVQKGSDPFAFRGSDPFFTPGLPLVDPGAAAVVASMLDGTGLQAGAKVRLAELRNQSRAAHAEFTAAMSRLAGLLNSAADNRGLAFTPDADGVKTGSDPFFTPDYDYELRGSVYLLRVDGRDVWEVFLTLHRPGRTGALWQSDGPVRLSRHPSEAGRQITYPVGRAREKGV